METLPFLGPEPPSGTPEKKSRGRPKGSKNKASADLRRFIAASTGSTPGQQLAQLVMVTAKDIREGKKALAEQGIDMRGMTPMMIGYWQRRETLKRLFKWDDDKADAVMAKMLDILMPYVHQSQGKAEVEKVDTRPVIYADSVALGSKGNPSQGLDFQEEISFGPMPATQALPHMDGKA